MITEILWGYIPTNREYIPRGYLKNYARGTSESLTLARAQAPRESKGRQKTRLKPRRMPPLEMPG